MMRSFIICVWICNRECNVFCDRKEKINIPSLKPDDFPYFFFLLQRNVFSQMSNNKNRHKREKKKDMIQHEN